MRCARCGNENPDGNRFCGMCGATLLTAPPPVASVPAQVVSPRPPVVPVPAPSSPAQPQNPVATRTSAPVSEEPVISGPSFLGLNDPGPRKRASLSAEPGSSSSNLDYLLEDEEEPRRGGAGKYVLILVALALAVGFGYLRWKNQNFGWLGIGETSKCRQRLCPQIPTRGTQARPLPPVPTSTTTPASTPSIQPETNRASGLTSPTAGEFGMATGANGDQVGNDQSCGSDSIGRRSIDTRLGSVNSGTNNGGKANVIGSCFF